MAHQHRFDRIGLQANRLADLKEFYEQTLKLTVTSESDNKIMVRAGLTEIEFVETPESQSAEAYHFAFNIPENKIHEAVRWMRGRAELLTHPDTRQQIVHFDWWNAHSIYFFDPQQNLVEFIAHHRLDNSRSRAFSEADILYASEIGLVVDDVDRTQQELGALLGITCFADETAPEGMCTGDVFRAVGDPLGFFIIVKKNRPWLMTETAAQPEQLTIAVTSYEGPPSELVSAKCTIVSAE